LILGKGEGHECRKAFPKIQKGPPMFELTEEQNLMKKSVSEFAERELAPQAC